MQKILIVDDIATNRKLLKQTLRALKDYEIIEAANGLEAIERYKEDAPDLILMDINMPEMDGFTATRIIRRKQVQARNGEHMPIIAMTAGVMIDDREACLSGGMDDFVAKPFRQADLEKVLRRWFSME